MAGFVHLHTHSHYSFLQALPKVPELVKKAKKEGMAAIGLTDAGNMHGAIELYKKAKDNEIHAVLGVDAYLADGSRLNHEPGVKRSRLVLLAETNEGYQNLLKLITLSFTEGFAERPMMDREILRTHAKGLIALIPSFAGDVGRLLAEGNDEAASAALAEYVSIFGKDNVFLEVTHHPKVEGHTAKMKQILKLSETSGVPVVAQHDVYYLSPGDSEATEVMRRIAHGSEGRNESEDFSFVTERQMLEWFEDNKEAVYRSGEIAERCQVELKLGSWVFPKFPTDPGKTHEDMLRERAYAGLSARGLIPTPEVTERLEYELKVIIDKGFAPYFLVVSDLLTFAKSAGILTTTRGSAAGSLVSYSVGITNVDPLEYKLPFERFLNPERPKAPDIDMDYADNRRDEMLAYAREKYGDDKVAQIGTFGTMMARAAVRDISRALGHSYGTGDRIAKLIPMGSQGFPMTIDRAMEIEADLKTLYEEDDDAKEIIDLAKKIEGCARHTGVHAAGVVISPTPLTDWTPLQTDPKTGKLITQYDMHAVEDAGLLKFDFLGIKNLSILSDAVTQVRETQGMIIDIESIPLDDHKTFAMLARGETEGTFQLNGSGMTRYLKELRPSSIHDINAMVALYRPGPMETIPQYIERKANPKLITYIDERMKEYLDASYGLLVYQDDVLLTAITLGGYSWLEADTLRKAMGKKIPAEMEAQKQKLLDGFKSYGKLSDAKGERLWKLIEPFAAYGFNKCLTGETRIYNPMTGATSTIASLLQSRSHIPVAALTREQTFITADATYVRENGVKPVLRLTTRSGRTIRATATHPLLTFGGWRSLGELSPGERIAVPRRLPFHTHTVSVPSHEAVVLGYLLSEGNLCHPNGLYFYSTQESEIHDFTWAALLFPNARISLNRSKSAVSVYVGKHEPTLPNHMRQWAKELGIIGKRATEKAIPDAAFSWNEASLAILLGKMWQGDGAVSLRNDQVFYATSSERLARDVQHLLLRFSILSTIHTKKFTYRGGYKTGYTVVVTGSENLSEFAATIGEHLLGIKQMMLDQLVMRSRTRTNTRGRGTTDTVPVAVLSDIRYEAALADMSVAELARYSGISPRLLSNDVRKRGYTRPVLAKIAEAISSPTLAQHATSDVFWDEVTTIVPDGSEMTYDLSVEGLENFVANDFIVHNSHAASYGKVAYQTAYMKANYPVEYMAALLTADAGDTESIAILVAEAERLSIPVLPPDVNESGSVFTVVGEKKDTIRFGLSSIKNFGEGISETILKERTEQGPFTSLSDFLTRVESRNLNRKSLESLVKAGALDRFAPEEGGRGTLLQNLDHMLAFHREASATSSQDSLFGAMAAPTLTLTPGVPISLSQQLLDEKELLGIYVSGHPLDAHTEATGKASLSIAAITEDPKKGLPIIIPVLVSECRALLTKKGDKMAFVKFEDKTGSIEAVVFPKLFKERGEMLVPGTCLLVKGNVSERNGEISLAVENLKPL